MYLVKQLDSRVFEISTLLNYNFKFQISLKKEKKKTYEIKGKLVFLEKSEENLLFKKKSEKEFPHK